MEVRCDSSSGSIEPSKIELKISAGPWSIARHIDIADRSRVVIQFEKDDCGGLCPRIGLETKGLRIIKIKKTPVSNEAIGFTL